jgi:hypothetical protein
VLESAFIAAPAGREDGDLGMNSARVEAAVGRDDSCRSFALQADKSGLAAASRERFRGRCRGRHRHQTTLQRRQLTLDVL